MATTANLVSRSLEYNYLKKRAQTAAN